MKAFVILSVLVSVAMGRPRFVQLGPVPSLQHRVSASASASAPQQLSLLRLLPNGQDLDSLDQASRDEAAQQEAIQQQQDEQQAALDNARGVLQLLPLVSASSSASASPTVITADGRLIQSQQRLVGVNPLLSTAHLAQSLASVSPTGASSSSSVQILESPELAAARLQQNLLLAQASGIQPSGLPVLLGTDGRVLTSPLLVL